MDLESVTAYQACLLHARADRNLREAVTVALKPYGVTKNEWLLLAAVSESPVEGYQMRELAEMLDVGMPHVTALLSKLEDLRLATQKKHPEDKRRRSLHVTKKGTQLLGKVEMAVRKELRNYVADVPRGKLVDYYSVVLQLAGKTNKQYFTK